MIFLFLGFGLFSVVTGYALHLLRMHYLINKWAIENKPNLSQEQNKIATSFYRAIRL